MSTTWALVKTMPGSMAKKPVPVICSPSPLVTRRYVVAFLTRRMLAASIWAGSGSAGGLKLATATEGQVVRGIGG